MQNEHGAPPAVGTGTESGLEGGINRSEEGFLCLEHLFAVGNLMISVIAFVERIAVDATTQILLLQRGAFHLLITVADIGDGAFSLLFRRSFSLQGSDMAFVHDHIHQAVGAAG